MLKEEIFKPALPHSMRLWCIDAKQKSSASGDLGQVTWRGGGRVIERKAEVSKSAPPLSTAATSQRRTGETPAEAPPQRSQVLCFTNYSQD